jgi:hypothetical protein
MLKGLLSMACKDICSKADTSPSITSIGFLCATHALQHALSISRLLVSEAGCVKLKLQLPDQLQLDLILASLCR